MATTHPASGPGVPGTSASEALPITFSLVGVQKSATSTLHTMLCRHRNIARMPFKEWHFFDDEERRWDTPDYSEYRFRPARSRVRLVGDATPNYLFWPNALERMRAYRPQMQLIAVFRDPIERAFSQWSMERARDAAFPDFGDAIRDPRYMRLPRSTTREEGRRHGILRTRSLVARGLYGQQLRRGFDLFDPAQWLLLEFGEFVRDHAHTLDQVTDFLGVPAFRSHPPLVRRGPTPDDHAGKPPSADDISRLADWYADDLAVFRCLSGLETDHWTTSRILDGREQSADVAQSLAERAGLDS